MTINELANQANVTVRTIRYYVEQELLPPPAPGYPAEYSEDHLRRLALIRRLKDRGYLNDSQYAASFTSLRRDNQQFGRMRVITDLKTKGVHGDLINTAVDAAYEAVDEEKQAREYLRKKRLEKPKDQKHVARIFRQLARAGFRTKTIIPFLGSPTTVSSTV